MNKTRVDVVSGFLGAGKTTFIKKLLSEVVKDQKTVLIENEFGEVSVDGGFLKNSGVEIREMSQGCICCSLVGDFAASLKEILDKFSPDRVIIEPSGVGKLSDVLKAIAGVEKELGVEENSAVTVVDCKKCKLYSKNFGEFFNNQIQFASTIVLSRTDVADRAKVNEAVEIIRTVNPTARIITTPIDLLSGEKLLEILESPVDLQSEMIAQAQTGEDPEEHEHHHHHHHDEDEHEHGHHHHDDDDDEDEHEHHHHNDDEHEHEHHHHHDGEECDDPECECHHHHDHDHCGHHHADEVFESWGKENVPAISEAKLRSILEKISETEEYGESIVRAKGMVPSDVSPADWLYFDVVPGEISVRHDQPDATGKVCVIGAELHEDKLEEAFA